MARTRSILNFNVFLFILILTLCGCQPSPSIEVSTLNIVPKTVRQTEADEQAISQALQETVSQHEEALAYLIYEVTIDRLDFSADRSLAVVWISLIDPENGEVLPGEPGLALAFLQQGGENVRRWEITLPPDPSWSEAIARVPEELLSAELKIRYMPKIQAAQKDPKVYRGYRLPWESGRAVRVSGSIGHVFTYKSCPSTCLYAFDFADGTMFPVVAAKGGQVKYAVWNWPNGNPKHANYLVLQDDTTTPTTFQVYYHLAQGSIPEKFRNSGTEVLQGEFLGLADDTGYSTGHHLHFHVHTKANSVWGTSVDVVFDEVKTNGGRPRTCTEAAHFPEYGAQCQAGNWYTSENGDRERPTGRITQPLPNESFLTPVVTVRGSASDDTGIGYIQVMATGDGEWKPVGPLLTKSPFTLPIDLCEAGIPNGPFFLSLQVMDKAGKLSENTPGLVQLNKQFSCPNDPPLCIPNENQVALYSEPYYHGSCAVFEIGEYPQLKKFPEINADNADSIQVGGNVLAILFAGDNLSGAQDTFLAPQSDLSSTVVGVNRASSLTVKLRPYLPTPPILDFPAPNDNESLNEDSTITLSWSEGPKETTYRAELTGPSGWRKTRDWQTVSTWKVGKLPHGAYEWTVRARNVSGESQSTATFKVAPRDLPPVTELFAPSNSPNSTALKLQWRVVEGADDLAFVDIQMSKDGSGWEDWKAGIAPEFREMNFLGKAGSTYAFRMRGVDRAGNTEIYPQKAEIKVLLPLHCTADPFDTGEISDDDKDSAPESVLNTNTVHNLCGQQDVDWIRFSAESGSSYRFQINPISEGVTLHVKLYGESPTLFLNEASSFAPQEAIEINWTAPDSDTYYLRVSAADLDLFGTDTYYEVRIDRTARLQPRAYLWSTLLLPLVWAMGRFVSRLTNRFRPPQ